MRQILLFIVFALAIAGVGYVATTPVDATYLSDVSGAPARIETRLQAAAEAALVAEELDWASVEMVGQFAVLRGEAPRDEERAEALAAVRAADGAGGVARGGVVAVRDLVTIAPPVSPYEWRAVRDGGRVTLVGAVPTRAAKAGLVSYAGDLFPGGVADQMTIARGAPDEAAWVNVARTAISQLAALSEGRATLRDERLTIEGEAPNPIARDRVTAALAHLPSPFLAAARVESPADVDPALASLAEEGEGLEPITDPAVCADVFASLTADAEVEFAAGEPAIAKESYPLLDQVAIAALRCTDVRLTIVGRGEPDAEPERYAALGADRARAVADYFILKGVAQDRLAAEAGAAPEAGPDDEVQRNVDFIFAS